MSCFFLPSLFFFIFFLFQTLFFLNLSSFRTTKCWTSKATQQSTSCTRMRASALSQTRLVSRRAISPPSSRLSRCVCVCTYGCFSLSVCVCVGVCVIWYDKSAQQFRLRPPVCHGVSVYVFTHVCMSVSVCVHACMHACMHVCMHACMYGTVCFGGPLIRTLPAIPAMHTTPKKKIYHLAGGQRSMRCAYTPSK